MNNHQQNLYNYAYELATDRAQFDDGCYFLTVADLDQDEKAQFAHLILEAYDRDTCDLICDTDMLSALCGLLESNTNDTRDTFAQKTIEAAIKNFGNTMQEMLDDMCGEMQQDLFDTDPRYLIKYEQRV